MSALHANVHVIEHAPKPVVVRDHREVKATPVVRDHRVEVRDNRDRDRDGDRDRDRDRDDYRVRPIVIAPAPVVVSQPVYTAPVYTSSWAPAPSYTYQPQPIVLTAPASLASGELSFDITGKLGNLSTLQLAANGQGATYVTQVIVRDADGCSQVTNVNAMLSAQNPTYQLPIANGANATSITIVGHSDWGGAVTLEVV